LTARRDGIVCPSCSPSSDGHVVIVRDGKICPEEIAALSTDQLRSVYIVHALAPHPEVLGFAAEVMAAVRGELAARGVL
jgi:hypothetical protein